MHAVVDGAKALGLHWNDSVEAEGHTMVTAIVSQPPLEKRARFSDKAK